jgi:hypothetical protein
MYLIHCLCPRKDIDMNCHAFQIDLAPEVPEYVKRSKITESQVYHLVKTQGNAWLDACGYTEIFDPENCGAWADKDKPPGPTARRLYEASESIRVSWGEWGPEHISVPGSACGLDIDDSSFGCVFSEGRALLPHNIDGWPQKQLLLR